MYSLFVPSLDQFIRILLYYGVLSLYLNVIERARMCCNYPSLFRPLMTSLGWLDIIPAALF